MPRFIAAFPLTKEYHEEKAWMELDLEGVLAKFQNVISGIAKQERNEI